MRARWLALVLVLLAAMPMAEACIVMQAPYTFALVDIRDGSLRPIEVTATGPRTMCGPTPPTFDVLGDRIAWVGQGVWGVLNLTTGVTIGPEAGNDTHDGVVRMGAYGGVGEIALSGEGLYVLTQGRWLQRIDLQTRTAEPVSLPFPLGGNSTAFLAGPVLVWLPWDVDGWYRSISAYDLATGTLILDEADPASLGIDPAEGDRWYPVRHGRLGVTFTASYETFLLRFEEGAYRVDPLPHLASAIDGADRIYVRDGDRLAWWDLRAVPPVRHEVEPFMPANRSMYPIAAGGPLVLLRVTARPAGGQEQSSSSTLQDAASAGEGSESSPPRPPPTESFSQPASAQQLAVVGVAIALAAFVRQRS